MGIQMGQSFLELGEKDDKLYDKNQEKGRGKDAVEKYYMLSLDSVDYVPASMPDPEGGCRLVMAEDNDAVIKLLRKGGAPTMSHASRTHRVNLDWLLEKNFDDPLYLRQVYRREATTRGYSHEASLQRS